MPGAGVEPARTFKSPADFKSAASSNSATPAFGKMIIIFKEKSRR